MGRRRRYWPDRPKVYKHLICPVDLLEFIFGFLLQPDITGEPIRVPYLDEVTIGLFDLLLGCPRGKSKDIEIPCYVVRYSHHSDQIFGCS